MARRKPLVREVNPHLICVLCSGYFIEATTIIECLHSFCRSCLIKYLENNKFCPICDVQLHKNNPLLSVRVDPLLQQLVYKLVPGLYANEMSRRRKYYSELGGPTSDPAEPVYPVADAYFSPTDSISLSLEFSTAPLTGGKEGETKCPEQDNLEKQALHHRRYLQCPAAVNISHLKKFLRMKYDLTPDYEVEIIYADEVLTDEFSLMDVAYTFSWNKTTPMRFQFRLLQRKVVRKPIRQYKNTKKVRSHLLPEEASVLKLAEEAEAKLGAEECKTRNHMKQSNGPAESDEGPDEETKEEKQKEDVESDTKAEDVETKMEVESEAQGAVEDNEFDDDEDLERIQEEEGMERMEEEGVDEAAEDRLEEDALIEEEAVEEEPVVEKAKLAPLREDPPKESVNGLKRLSAFDLLKQQEVPQKKPKLSPRVEDYKQDEKRFLEDMIEEDTDDDRLRISASEEEKSPDPLSEVERVVEEKPRFEERRKKKSKKGKHHHHHHRHRRCESPPSAQIVHSPENDVMKLKVKLFKSSDKGYSLSDSSDSWRDYRESKEPSNKPVAVEKSEKVKSRDDESKKEETPVKNSYVLNTNNNNTNNNNNDHSKINNNILNGNNHKINNNVTVSRSPSTANSNTVQSTQSSGNSNHSTSKVIAEFKKKAEESNKERKAEMVAQKLNAVNKKATPKVNGLAKLEAPLRSPPSSITVSKITAAEKREMEQQKLLMNRSQSNGFESKRPSLEIMLVNAPKKADSPNGLKKPDSPPKTPEPPRGVASPRPAEGKKVMRPTPPSIPLSRLPKGMVPGKGSPPPLRAVPRLTMEEALDLSGKSSRKSPDSELQRAVALKQASVNPYSQPLPRQACKPNPTVRQIPNPSALIFRQNNMAIHGGATGTPATAPVNNNSLKAPPPAVLPLSSLRQMETMTRKIEKVAAGLSVKAAATSAALYPAVK